MDKKRRETMNIIILLIIIFAGINYSLFTFVIEPMIFEKNELETQVKANSFALSAKEQDALRLGELEKEVSDLSVYGMDFDDKITDELDTVVTTVEFYDYIKGKNGQGIRVTYNLDDIVQGIEEEAEEELNEETYVTITDPMDPNYDPYVDPSHDLYDRTLDPNFQVQGLQIEELVSGEEDVLYRTAIIGLNVEIHKNHLYRYLQDFQSSLSRYFTVTSINVSSQGLLTDPSQSLDNDGEVLLEDNSLVTKSSDLLKLEIELRTYVKDGVEVEDRVKVYDFYSDPSTHQVLRDLF